MTAGLPIDVFILLAGGLLLAAALTAAFAARPDRRFRVPGALLFLGIGMFVGSDVLDWSTSTTRVSSATSTPSGHRQE